MLLRNIIAFLLLLAFGLQTFSYGVLLTRYKNHFDCQQKEENICHHKKDASSCCDGQCALAKEIKKENDLEGNNQVLKTSKIPEPAVTHLPDSFQPCFVAITTEKGPDFPPPHYTEGNIRAIFHPPLF